MSLLTVVIRLITYEGVYFWMKPLIKDILTVRSEIGTLWILYLTVEGGSDDGHLRNLVAPPYPSSAAVVVATVTMVVSRCCLGNRILLYGVKTLFSPWAGRESPISFEPIMKV